jgi:hypothetical protein
MIVMQDRKALSNGLIAFTYTHQANPLSAANEAVAASGYEALQQVADDETVELVHIEALTDTVKVTWKATKVEA